MFLAKKSGHRAINPFTYCLSVLSNRLLSKCTHWPLPEPKWKGQVQGETADTMKECHQICSSRGGVLVCSGCHNKEPQAGGLNNKNLSSHSSRGFKIKALEDLVSSKALLLRLGGHLLLGSSLGFSSVS